MPTNLKPKRETVKTETRYRRKPRKSDSIECIDCQSRTDRFNSTGTRRVVETRQLNILVLNNPMISDNHHVLLNPSQEMFDCSCDLL